jgi:hypothetical protein
MLFAPTHSRLRSIRHSKPVDNLNNQRERDGNSSDVVFQPPLPETSGSKTSLPSDVMWRRQSADADRTISRRKLAGVKPRGCELKRLTGNVRKQSVLSVATAVCLAPFAHLLLGLAWSHVLAYVLGTTASAFCVYFETTRRPVRGDCLNSRRGWSAFTQVADAIRRRDALPSPAIIASVPAAVDYGP